MCPWDESMHRALTIFYLFLPTCLDHNLHDKYGARLWFEEMWHWFTKFEVNAIYEQRIESILSRFNFY